MGEIVNKFGEISYEDYPKLTNDFVTMLREGKIVGNSCNTCGNKYFPPRSGCENMSCNEGMSYFDMPTVAKLVAFTIIHFPPDSHADKAPYIVAIGEFENNLRVLAHLVGVTSKPKVGMQMNLKAQSVGEDRAIYKFTKM